MTTFQAMIDALTSQPGEFVSKQSLINVLQGIQNTQAAHAADIATNAASIASGGSTETVDVAALTLRTKYAIAAANRVHMEADLDLVALAALAGNATQPQATARANAIKASLRAHLTDVGTPLADGSHWHSDTTNDGILAAVPDATNSATCITLIVALAAGINAHLTQASVHFHDDAVTPMVLTVDPPVTLANQITDLNQVRQFILDHNSLASQ